MFKAKGFWTLIVPEQDLEALPSVASTSSHWSELTDPEHCVQITKSHPHCFFIFLTYWTIVVWVEYQKENSSLPKYSEIGSSQEPLLVIPLKLLGLLSLSWKKIKKKSVAQLRKCYIHPQKFSWEASEEFNLILPWCCLLFRLLQALPRSSDITHVPQPLPSYGKEEFFCQWGITKGNNLMGISNEGNAW